MQLLLTGGNYPKDGDCCASDYQWNLDNNIAFDTSVQAQAGAADISVSSSSGNWHRTDGLYCRRRTKHAVCIVLYFTAVKAWWKEMAAYNGFMTKSLVDWLPRDRNKLQRNVRIDYRYLSIFKTLSTWTCFAVRLGFCMFLLLQWLKAVQDRTFHAPFNH